MSYEFRGQFPTRRMRRMRRDDFSRRLVREHRLTADDLIYPAFVLDGTRREEPVASLPGIARKSVDLLFRDAERCLELGVPALALFPVIPAELKSDDAAEAWHSKGLVPRAVGALKERFHFLPGKALAYATVTQVNRKDSIARVHTSHSRLPSGARAVALLPPPTGQRIPIRILEVPTNRRAFIEETLKKNIKDVDLVGQETTAKFCVDMAGDALRLLTADGLQVVATFNVNEPWGTGIGTIVARSANAAELLTLENPSSQLKIDVRVATSRKSKPSVTARGIKVVADIQAAKYRISAALDRRR